MVIILVFQRLFHLNFKVFDIIWHNIPVDLFQVLFLSNCFKLCCHYESVYISGRVSSNADEIECIAIKLFCENLAVIILVLYFLI